MAGLQKVKFATSEFDYVYNEQNANVVKGFGAPYLIPAQKGNVVYDVWGNKEYPWSLSPNNVTQFIPGLTLKEYRLKYSSELLSLFNSAKGILEASDRALTSGQVLNNDLTQEFIQAALVGKTGNLFTPKSGRLPRLQRVLGRSRILQLLFQNLASGTQIAAGFQLQEGIIQALANPDALLLSFEGNRQNNKLQNPYEGLYYATPTYLNYNIPYVSINNMVDIDSSWREPGKEGPVTKGIQLSKDVLAKLTDNRSTTGITSFDLSLAAIETAAFAGEPGTGKEKIKGFAPSETGDSVTVTFYLYNTLHFSHIKNNWEFLYVLTYQNLPNRRSVNLLDPPCVYEMVIPGYKRFPIANIEKLKVENVGLTRHINIDTGEIVTRKQAIGNEFVKMIPEAYKVTLTIRSLLTTTQNLFTWYEGSNSQVPVKVISTAGPDKNKAEQKIDLITKAVAKLGEETGNAFEGLTDALNKKFGSPDS